MNGLISVIVPVYNTNQYLKRCLDSIINNTYRNLEIICIDDGSTDGSLETLRRYEASDPRVIVIAKENGGVSSARNAGLEIARGEFITFIDSDDFIHPQFFELLVNVQKGSDCDCVICGLANVEDDTDYRTLMQKIDYEPHEVRQVDANLVYKQQKWTIYCTGRLLRKSIIANTRFPLGLSYGEDTIFTAMLWEKNPKMTCCIFPYDLYFYYQRKGSARDTDEDLNILHLFDELLRRTSPNQEGSHLYYIHIIKKGLPLRYRMKYIYRDTATASQCDRALKKCRSHLLKSNRYSVPEKIYYLLAIQFPSIDRQYRIHREPGYRRWEEAVKRTSGK